MQDLSTIAIQQSDGLDNYQMIIVRSISWVWIVMETHSYSSQAKVAANRRHQYFAEIIDDHFLLLKYVC